MEGIYNIISSNPETAVDVLSWASLGVGTIIGCIFGLLGYVSIGLTDFLHVYFRDRKAKKSGKLTNEQRLELLEEKIDSLANIVISSSPEEK